MATSETDLSTLVYCDKPWIQFNGGWLHSNNILFYFAQSPFFDRQSSNNTIITQNSGIPERELKYLSTKQRFEEELTRYAGVQYVVEWDPMENEVFVDVPGGGVGGGSGGPGKERSMIWVIKKIERKRARSSEVEVLGYYYIIDDTIYHAPNMLKILEYRLMNTCLAIDKVVNTTMNLPPYFTPTNGYSYFKPGQKAAGAVTGMNSTQSRLGTPMPDGSEKGSTQDRVPPSSIVTATAIGSSDPHESSTQTLRSALNLTLRYYDQYDDETPLLGEPGNFRYAKSKDPVSTLKAAEVPLRSVGAPVKAGTPAPSVQNSAVSGTGPFAGGRVGTGVGTGTAGGAEAAVDPMKRKRKKSRAVNDLG